MGLIYYNNNYKDYFKIVLMRQVRGYVFIPRFENHGNFFESLFGPNLGKNSRRNYDNLENNGINPFENYCLAVLSAKDYFREMIDCVSIDFGRVGMRIAESDDEFEVFKKLEKLIVIMKSGDFQGERLLGPYVEGKLGFGAIPGGFLGSTEFETYTFANSPQITPFERAKYLASEVHRQGQCGATIATFSLKRFKRRLTR